MLIGIMVKKFSLIKFKNNFLVYSLGEIRSEFEIPYMVRYYRNNGSIDVNRTLYNINLSYEKLYKKKLTKLPVNDDEFL
jgi:hypothetical protein